MLFGEKILDYWDDILKDLATVVAIPSVAKPQEGEHPFGDQCARALGHGGGDGGRLWPEGQERGLPRRPRGVQARARATPW